MDTQSHFKARSMPAAPKSSKARCSKTQSQTQYSAFLNTSCLDIFTEKYQNIIHFTLHEALIPGSSTIHLTIPSSLG